MDFNSNFLNHQLKFIISLIFDEVMQNPEIYMDQNFHVNHFFLDNFGRKFIAF